MQSKDEPVVVSSFKKDDGPEPVFVAEGKEADIEPVILKYDIKKNEEKKGFYVQMPKVTLTSVALKNMAEEIGKALKNEGMELRGKDLKLFVSSLTSRLIYIPKNDSWEYMECISKTFCGNVFYAKSQNDSAILKCAYSAITNPLVIHFLLWDNEKGHPMPEYLIKYISLPSSNVEMMVNEYVNDIYINKIKLPDNIYIVMTGDLECLDKRLYKKYVIWDPRLKRCEKDNQGFKIISMNSFKNMHKVMDTVSDNLWSKMSTIEEVLNSMNFTLENKDCNSLDDYLVTLYNQEVLEEDILKYLCEYRLFPMVKNFIDLNEFKRRLNELGIYKEGREI